MTTVSTTSSTEINVSDFHNAEVIVSYVHNTETTVSDLHTTKTTVSDLHNTETTISGSHCSLCTLLAFRSKTRKTLANSVFQATAVSTTVTQLITVHSDVPIVAPTA